LAEAHTALALEAMSHRYDWPRAEERFKRVLELDPNNVDALVWYGLFLGGIRGQIHEARTFMERAQRLDPLSRNVAYNLRYLYLWEGSHQAAVGAFEELTESDPEFYLGWEGLAEALSAVGRHEEAIQILESALVHARPDYDWPSGLLGYLYGRVGRRADALAQLERIDELAASGRYVSPVISALVYAGLNEPDQAFIGLERAYEQGAHWLIWLGANPHFRGALSHDRRFTDLLRRMNLFE
jgi:tetratricopeptide (TPR) repeat protein